MADAAEVKPTKFGFEVRRVANGLMLEPPRYYDGRCREYGEVYVFATMTELAAWLLAQEGGL